MKNFYLISFLILISFSTNLFSKTWDTNICVDSVGKRKIIKNSDICPTGYNKEIVQSPTHVTCSIYDFNNRLIGSKEGHFSVSLNEFKKSSRQQNVCGKCDDPDSSGRGCNYVLCGYKTASGVNVFEQGSSSSYEKISCNKKPIFSCPIKIGDREYPDYSGKTGVLAADEKSYTCNYQCKPGDGVRLKKRKYSISVHSKTGEFVSTEITEEREFCTDSCTRYATEKPVSLNFKSTECRSANLCKVPVACSRQISHGNYKSFALCPQPNGVFCSDMTDAQISDCLNDSNRIIGMDAQISDDSSFIVQSRELTKQRDELKKNLKLFEGEELGLKDAVAKIKLCEPKTADKNEFWDPENWSGIEKWIDPNEQLNRYFLVELPTEKGAIDKSKLDQLKLAEVLKLDLINSKSSKKLQEELIKKSKEEIVKLAGLCPKSDYSKITFENFAKGNVHNPRGEAVDLKKVEIVNLKGKSEELTDIISKFIKQKSQAGLNKKEIKDILDGSWGEDVFSLTSGTDPLLGTVDFSKLIANKNLIDQNCESTKKMINKESPQCIVFSDIYSQFEKTEKKAKESCLKDHHKLIKELEKAAEKSVQKYVLGLERILEKGSSLCEERLQGITKLRKSILAQIKNGANLGLSAQTASFQGCHICQVKTIKMVPNKGGVIDEEASFDSILNQQFSDQISGTAVCSSKDNSCPSVSECVRDGSFDLSTKDFSSDILKSEDVQKSSAK